MRALIAALEALRHPKTDASGRVFEHRCVKVNCFFRLTAHVAYKHEHRGNSLLYLNVASVYQLPGNSVPIFHPAIPFAEGIAAKRHPDVPAPREFFPYRIDFVLRLAFNMKRNGRIGLKKRSGADRHKWLSRKFERDNVAIA